MTSLPRTAFTLLSAALVAACPLLAQDPGLKPPPRIPPVMHFDPAWLCAHETRHEALPRTFIDPARYHQIARSIAAGAANVVTLLPFLDYTPSKWYQGGCGNCWIWGSTAAASIQLAANGTRDLLSVQYMNSGYNGGQGQWACCGGDSATYADWYNHQKKLVPARNSGASFRDGNASCEGQTAQPFSSIGTTPSYPIKGMSSTVVPTLGVPKAQAILNIKTLLSQNHPLTFSFFLPGAGWSDFERFWSNDRADTPWAGVDKYDGTSFDSQAGGHLVCLVGYDDRDKTWILLNSWGATPGRPQGTFKLPQDMGYTNTMWYSGQSMSQYEFDAYDIGLPASPHTVTASIMAPPPGTATASGQALTFKGTGTDSSPTSPLTYTWSFGDGATAQGATVTHTYTNQGTTAMVQQVTLTAMDATHAKGSAVTTVTVSPSTTPGSQLLVNPGFELGTQGWKASPGVIGAFGPRQPAHGGKAAAWLCGYDRAHADALGQTVILPEGPTTLSFWLHVDTAKTGSAPRDTLKVHLLNAIGKELATLATYTDLDAADGWRKRSFDLSPWKGQVVEIHLDGAQRGRSQTSFLVDDFVLGAP